MIEKAIQLAYNLHLGCYRKSGEPYISHPLAVAEILKESGFSEKVQIAGILHDLCEDTSITNIEISHQFGEDIAFVVYSLSKNKKQKKEEYNGDLRMSIYVRRLMIGATHNPMILYVKIADQIHNLSTLSVFSEEKQQRKKNEVKNYFLPTYSSFSHIPKEDEPKFQFLLKKLKEVLEM